MSLGRVSEEFRSFLGNAEARSSCLAEDLGDINLHHAGIMVSVSL